MSKLKLIGLGTGFVFSLFLTAAFRPRHVEKEMTEDHEEEEYEQEVYEVTSYEELLSIIQDADNRDTTVEIIDEGTNEPITLNDAEKRLLDQGARLGGEENSGTGKVREPLYGEGDMVITFNPYAGDIEVFEMDAITPLYFCIKAVEYDGADDTFRYQLEGEDYWYAEEWLVKPTFPVMGKIAEGYTGETAEDLHKELVDDRETLEAFDKQLHQDNIDRLLDGINKANENGDLERASQLEQELIEYLKEE